MGDSLLSQGQFEKAKNFYAEHHAMLSDFFHSEEILFIRRNKKPHENLAVLLAAKEAAFKASGGAWMGPRGFKTVRIAPKGKRRFVASNGHEIFFSKNKDYVVAQCVGMS